MADAVDIVLLDRLRGVLDNGDTTEAGLRELTDDAAGLVRALRGQVRASERRLRALNADPSSPIAEIAVELRRVEMLRRQLREARELAAQLDERARELRTAWLLRQADFRRTP